MSGQSPGKQESSGLRDFSATGKTQSRTSLVSSKARASNHSAGRTVSMRESSSQQPEGQVDTTPTNIAAGQQGSLKVEAKAKAAKPGTQAC